MPVSKRKILRSFGTWTTSDYDPTCDLTCDLIICLCMESYLLGDHKIGQGIDLEVWHML